MKRYFGLFGFVVLLSCNKNDNDYKEVYTAPNNPSSFLFSPIEIRDISYTLSLGWIQPSGHTIPTDHVYFWYKNTSNMPLPVYALASGKVQQILNVPVNGIKECKVWFRVNEKFSYYLDHIVLDAGIAENTMVQAGQKIGTTGLSASIDLGAIDETITLTGYANPKRYYSEELNCGKPFTYFTEPLKSQIYALVDREGSDKDGRIDIDIPGKLVGNWFLDDGNFYTDGPTGWEKELSFAFDIQHPTIPLVSIGGTIGLTGKWTIPDDAPVPAQISVANGKMAYRLYGSKADFMQRGLMILQMTDDTHIKVQVFPGSTATDASFTSDAKMYAR